MAERVPRRLKRFQRKGELPEEVEGISLDEAVYRQVQPEKKQRISKEVTMQLALDEVQRFKQQHQRLPKKGEYDRIAESIYRQLKDAEKRKKILEKVDRQKQKKLKPSERAKLRTKRRPRERGKQGKEEAFAELREAAKGISEKEIRGMSVEELFGEEKKASREAKPQEEAKPAEDEFSLGSLTDIESPEEAADKCPKCGQVAKQIIFCPECGSAFCENCAKKVQQQAAFKIFVCPSCGAKTKK